MERRRRRLLSTLFITLEKHGYAAKVDERQRPVVDIARQVVVLTIKEKYRQVRQPLTEEEKKRSFNPKRPWRQDAADWPLRSCRSAAGNMRKTNDDGTKRKGPMVPGDPERWFRLLGLSNFPLATEPVVERSVFQFWLTAL
jgi:hypothetical protein